MQAITLFEEGPAHRLLVESALRRKSDIGAEEMKDLPELERRAVALQWYAYEIRRNGLTNLGCSPPLVSEVRSALAWLNTDAARSTDALLGTVEELKEQDVEGTEHILSDMLDRLLLDAEQHFSLQQPAPRRPASGGWKRALALALLSDTIFVTAYAVAYLRRGSDGGAMLDHMRSGVPAAVLGNLIYAILWLPESRAGRWLLRHWFPLALAGVGLHLLVILALLLAGGSTADFYLNLRLFAVGAVGLLIARLAVGGRTTLRPERREPS